MKKLFALLSLCSMLALGASAQGFAKGDKVINLGVGLGSTLYSGSNYTSKFPPVSGSFELGIVDNLFNVDKMTLGVGGIVGYTSAKYEWGHGYGYKYTYWVVGARGSVHYQFVDRLDTYASVMLGYDIVSSKEYGDWSGQTYKANSSALDYSALVGARYYLSNNFAVFTELGYDIAFAKLGIALKF